LLRCERCYKTQKHYPITLKFSILKGGIRVHPDTKFGYNTTNVYKDYSQKITPIILCCLTWQEAENRQSDKLTIEPQTFCYLKEIKLNITKIQRKSQQWVTTTQ